MAIDVAIAQRLFNEHRTKFATLLDLRFETIGEGTAVLRLPFRDEVTNGFGAIHGGAIVSLCDSAFYVALASLYGPEQDTVTASLSCNFLRPALPPNDLVASASVLKAGRRIVYGEVNVTSGEMLVAHATMNFLNSPPGRGES